MPSKYICSSRTVSVDIIDDRRVNNLKGWHTVTAQFRSILKMDNMGRIEATPLLFKAMIFPRNNVSLDRVTKVCQQLHDEGLYFLYQAHGDSYLQSPSFLKRQKMVGHMKRASDLPAPDPQEFYRWLVDIRKDDDWINRPFDTCIEQVNDMLGICSDHVNGTLIPCKEHVTPEKKRKDGDGECEYDGEKKRTESTVGDGDVSSVDFDTIKKLITDNLEGENLPANIDNEIRSAIRLHGTDRLEDAIREAVLRNAPRWPYVLGILSNWDKE